MLQEDKEGGQEITIVAAEKCGVGAHSVHGISRGLVLIHAQGCGLIVGHPGLVLAKGHGAHHRDNLQFRTRVMTLAERHADDRGCADKASGNA